MPGENIIHLGACRLAHASVLHQPLHCRIAVKLRFAVRVCYLLGFHTLGSDFDNAILGSDLITLISDFACLIFAEKVSEFAITCPAQFLTLILGNRKHCLGCIKAVTQTLHETLPVMVALRSRLGFLDWPQPGNDPRRTLQAMLGLEANHHRHIVSPHVKCVTLAAYPFGNGEHRTLGKRRHSDLA